MDRDRIETFLDLDRYAFERLDYPNFLVFIHIAFLRVLGTQRIDDETKEELLKKLENLRKEPLVTGKIKPIKRR